MGQQKDRGRLYEGLALLVAAASLIGITTGLNAWLRPGESFLDNATQGIVFSAVVLICYPFLKKAQNRK